MTQTISAVQSAIKAKAPVVAIPIEGHAPFCVNANLLKGALKGVVITSAEVERIENESFPELGGQMQYQNGRSEYVKFEGPSNRVVSVSFSLRIRGTAGRVRTSARFVPMSRYNALKELSAWSDKERERLSKKKVLSVGSDSKERAKLAKYVTTHIDGDDAQTFYIRVKDQVKTVQGLPITLKAWADRSFFIHATRDENGDITDWTVTETSSGFAANKLVQKTALKAIEEAELNIASGNRENMLANILKNQLEQTMAA